jgi:hypothetical protein
MGGFVDGTEMLSLEEIERRVESNEIEYPIASEDEIKDRSKGDALAKALVVLQTTWFLLQCVARGSRGLALTELELVTAAFALLDVLTYAIWWDKPLDVQCPIHVRRTPPQQQHSGIDSGGGPNTTEGRAQVSFWHDAVHVVWRPFLATLSEDDISLAEDGRSSSAMNGFQIAHDGVLPARGPAGRGGEKVGVSQRRLRQGSGSG